MQSVQCMTQSLCVSTGWGGHGKEKDWEMVATHHCDGICMEKQKEGSIKIGVEVTLVNKNEDGDPVALLGLFTVNMFHIYHLFAKY